jgi:hypothetical protein
VRAAAPVIPIRAPEGHEAGALERAIRAPAGRGRVVLLAIRSDGDPSPRLRDVPGRSCHPVRYVVVDSDVSSADALASRILAGQCSGAPAAPRAVLRAWAAHLASEGHELAIALDRAGELSLDAASWLGGLIRASHDSMRVIVPWAEDPRIWRVIEELGLGTEVVDASLPGSRVDRAEPREPAASSEAAPVPERVSGPLRSSTWARRALLAGGLACLGVVAVALWRMSIPAEPASERGASEAMAAAIEGRSATSAGSTAPAVVRPEPSPDRYAYDVQADRISLRVSGEPLAQVLAELSAQLGFEVRNLTSAPLSRPVSLQVEGLPLEDALRELLRGYSRTFVYASSSQAGAAAPRLRTVIVLAATPPAAGSPGPVSADGAPESGSIALEVETAIQTLIAHDSGSLHADAIERLVAMDPAAVADEALRQFDALTPVGPLAPARVEAAWERLRAALCASRAAEGSRATLPAELGCRPSSTR